MRFNPSPYSPEMPDLGNYGLTATRTTTRTVSSLRQGSRGGDVEQLHMALDSNNPRRRYVTDAGATAEMIDSYFGPKTKTAVEAFQKDHRLGVDGKVGKNTWAALGTANTKFTTEQADIDSSGNVVTPSEAAAAAGTTAPTVTASTGKSSAASDFAPYTAIEEKVGLTKKKWFWPAVIGGSVVTIGLIVVLMRRS